MATNRRRPAAGWAPQVGSQRVPARVQLLARTEDKKTLMQQTAFLYPLWGTFEPPIKAPKTDTPQNKFCITFAGLIDDVALSNLGSHGDGIRDVSKDDFVSYLPDFYTLQQAQRL